MSKFDFSGKKVLLTGASRGYGKALALALVDAGATVYGVARSQKHLDELSTQNSKIVGICCDVSDFKKLEGLLKPHHPFHILINNAAVGTPQAFLDTTEAHYDQTLNINLKAPFFISQMVAKGMVEHKVDGVMLNVSSLGSKGAMAHNHSYCASKAALDHLSRCLAVELGPMGIRVNTINPGLIETDMSKEFLAQIPAEIAAPMLSKPIPLKTWPSMDDYVDTALYLISDKAKKVTGTNFVLASGYEL